MQEHAFAIDVFDSIPAEEGAAFYQGLYQGVYKSREETCADTDTIASQSTRRHFIASPTPYVCSPWHQLAPTPRLLSAH